MNKTEKLLQGLYSLPQFARKSRLSKQRIYALLARKQIRPVYEFDGKPVFDETSTIYRKTGGRRRKIDNSKG